MIILLCWLIFSTIFYAQVIVLEGCDMFTAFLRSMRLTAGYRLGIVGTLFVVGLIVHIITQVMNSMSMFLGEGLGQMQGAIEGLAMIVVVFIQTIVAILITPLNLIAVTMLYYDTRMRKEGFDLVVLSKAIGNQMPVVEGSELKVDSENTFNG